MESSLKASPVFNDLDGCFWVPILVLVLFIHRVLILFCLFRPPPSGGAPGIGGRVGSDSSKSPALRPRPSAQSTRGPGLDEVERVEWRGASTTQEKLPGSRRAYRDAFLYLKVFGGGC